MSSKFNEYKQLDLSKIGEEVLSYWKSEAILRKAFLNEKEQKAMSFLKGLPQPMGCLEFTM